MTVRASILSFQAVVSPTGRRRTVASMTLRKRMTPDGDDASCIGLGPYPQGH